MNQVSMLKASKKFDLLNFFYGFGAAVVLLAAMFKFSGVDYADEIFIGGVTVEALVFLISAFKWKEEEYKWDNVFPELVKREKEPTDDKSIRQTLEKFNTLMDSLGNVAVYSEQLSITMHKINYSVENMHNTLEGASRTTGAYQEELDKLRYRVKKMNERVNDLSNVIV